MGWVSELVEIVGGTDIADRRNRGAAKDRIVTAEEIVKREPDLIIGSWCGKRGESLEQACSSCSVAHSPYQIFDNPVIGYSEPVAARARARSAMVARIRFLLGS